MLIILAVIGAWIAYLCVGTVREHVLLARMTQDERDAYHVAHRQRWEAIRERYREHQEDRAHGPLKSVLVCPHCQTMGEVRIKETEVKRGISGGKATAAVLTAGWSLLATGLARKEQLTEAYCGHCDSTWHF